MQGEWGVGRISESVSPVECCIRSVADTVPVAPFGQGGPHERELLLRIGSLNAGDVSAVVGPEMLRELEAVPGVVAVEPVIEQREEALGEEVRVEHLDPSKVIHEV